MTPRFERWAQWWARSKIIAPTAPTYGEKGGRGGREKAQNENHRAHPLTH
jgi:hypothetical protein